MKDKKFERKMGSNMKINKYKDKNTKLKQQRIRNKKIKRHVKYRIGWIE